MEHSSSQNFQNLIMEVVAGHLQPMETPVIVARELHWMGPAEVERNRLDVRIVLDSWRQSMEQQDQVPCLSLDDDGCAIAHG